MKSLIGFILFLVAWSLMPLVTIVNYFNVRSVDYFRSTAIDIDIWSNREFRALWNKILRTDIGYQFGVPGETISSALGKNQEGGTLKKGGRILVWILNLIQKDHCLISIQNNL